MNKMNLFNFRHVTNDDIKLLESVAKSLELKLINVNAVDVKNVDTENGLLLANVSRLTTKCNGISIWATNTDFGVRVTRTKYDSFNDVQKFLLDTLSKRKNTVTERRYSFIDMKDVVKFLVTLKAYENTATKEIEVAESVSA